MPETALKNTVRWTTIIALFIIPFLPLVVANSFFFPFITGKNFAFRALVEIAFAGWAMLAVADPKYRPKFSWTFVLFTAFVVWMAIADSFAINPVKAFWSNFERMDGWVTLIHVYLLFVVTSAFFSVENLWKKWWGTFLIGSALICFYCVMQLLHLVQIHQGGVRLDASFGNAEYLAAYLLFGVAISVWQYLEVKVSLFKPMGFTREWWLKAGLALLTVVQVLMLLFSETRGAIIGGAGAVVLAALLWAIESGKKRRNYAFAALALMLVLAGAVYLGRDSKIVQSIPGVDRVASISLSDSETTARFKIWHMAYEGFLARPIVGWGQEGFNYVFNTYYDSSLYGQEQWFDRAHDVFLDWLVAGGAPALLLFVALFISTVIALYRAPISRSERLVFISALAAYCFQGLFVFDNLFTYVPLAVIIGMAHAVSSRPYKILEKVPPFEVPLFNTVIIPVGAVALLLALWFVNVPNVRAASDLIAAITPASDPTENIAAFKQTYSDGSYAFQEITEQLISLAQSTIQDQSMSNTTKLAVFTYAYQQMQALVVMIPNDARIRYEYAVLMRASGNYPQALTEIKAAEALSPTKQTIIQEEGLEEWQMGSTTAAAAAFIRAYKLDTTNKTAAAMAAAGAIAAGDTANGKALLQQVFGTTAVNNDLLMIAYYQAHDYADLIAVLQQKVKETKGDVNAEFQLAEAYSDNKQFALARAEIQQAITEHPEAASQGAAILAQIPAK